MRIAQKLKYAIKSIERLTRNLIVVVALEHRNGGDKRGGEEDDDGEAHCGGISRR